MSEEQKKLLEKQLWNIADILRGKMGADEYRDYVLGFIFFKYLSENLYKFANIILENDHVLFDELDESKEEHQLLLKQVKVDCIDKLGYYLDPSELFGYIANKGKQTENGKAKFIIEDLERVLNNIEQSTMGTASEDDFGNLFEDLGLELH